MNDCPIIEYLCKAEEKYEWKPVQPFVDYFMDISEKLKGKIIVSIEPRQGLLDLISLTGNRDYKLYREMKRFCFYDKKSFNVSLFSSLLFFYHFFSIKYHKHVCHYIIHLFTTYNKIKQNENINKNVRMYMLIYILVSFCCCKPFKTWIHLRIIIIYVQCTVVLLRG